MNGDDMAYPCEGRYTTAYGFTKRELFAAMAMQGHLANAVNIGNFAEVAMDAVEQAEALLSALRLPK